MNENKMKTSPENAPTSGDRRKAIKKIAVGVGVLAGYSVLPEKWIPPIVGRIVLPAHAQTSGVTMCPDLTLTIVSGDTSTSTVSILVAGCVVPPTANQPIDITINGGSGCVFSEQLSTDGAGNFSGSFDVPCGPGIQTVCASAHVSNGPGFTACVDDPQPGKKNDGTEPAPHPPATTTPHPNPTTSTTPAPCADTNVDVVIKNGEGGSTQTIKVSYVTVDVNICATSPIRTEDLLNDNLKLYSVKKNSTITLDPYLNSTGISVVSNPPNIAPPGCLTSPQNITISQAMTIIVGPC